jgi:hypothetical protein
MGVRGGRYFGLPDPPTFLFRRCPPLLFLSFPFLSFPLNDMLHKIFPINQRGENLLHLLLPRLLFRQLQMLFKAGEEKHTHLPG